MIGVGLVNIVHALEIGFGVIGHPRTFGKAVDDGVAHGLPHQPDTAGIRRSVPLRQSEVETTVERIGFPDSVTGGLHGSDDLISDPVAANIAERAGEPSGNDTLPPIKEQVKNVGCVGNLGERRACVDRMGPEKTFGHVDQCRRQAEQALTILQYHLALGRRDQTHLEDGGAEQELGRPVPTFRRANSELLGNRAVSRVQEECLLGTDAPVSAEPFVEIGGTELPEARIPRRCISSAPPGAVKIYQPLMTSWR